MKRQQASPELLPPEKLATKDDEVLCCGLIRCGKPIEDSEQRVHLCCGPLKTKTKKTTVINWNQDTGRVILHGACWRDCSSLDISLQERRLLLIATKTAEFHDPEKDVQEKANLFVELLRSANHLVVFTGAGISTSAGIGDYRGISGKWTTEDLQVESEDLDDGVPYEELRPTYAHEALVKLQDLGHLKYVISQNCDGLHLLSGIKKENISEVHGNVFQEYCPKCNKIYSRKFYVLNDDSQEKDCPRCELDHRTERTCTAKVKRGNKTVTCKTILHDTIINFGDLLNEEILDRASNHARQCDLFLSLGSSMLVTPAATLVENAKAYVICNRQVTEYDAGATIRVWGDIDPFMKKVMKKLLGEEKEKIWCDSLASKKAHYDSMRKN